MILQHILIVGIFVYEYVVRKGQDSSIRNILRKQVKDIKYLRMLLYSRKYFFDEVNFVSERTIKITLYKCENEIYRSLAMIQYHAKYDDPL